MSYEFKTTIVVNDTELNVVVDFDYEPEERVSYHSPGWSASVQINSVTCEGVELQDFIVSCFDEILEQEAFDHIESISESDQCDKADYLFERMKEKRVPLSI